MIVEGGKAMMYSKMLHRTSWIIWKMLYQIGPRLEFCVYIYDACPPAFPVHLKGTCPWLLTGHLLLDLYHASFSEDLHMNYACPLAGRSCRKSTRAKVLEKPMKFEFHIFDVCPCFPCLHSRMLAYGYQPDTHHWTCTMPGSGRTCTWAMAPFIDSRYSKAQRSKSLKGCWFQFQVLGC